MATKSETIEVCLGEVERAQGRMSRIRLRQVRNDDDRDFLKATAYSWFNNHRPLLSGTGQGTMQGVDAKFQALLNATGKKSAKSTYIQILKEAKEALISLRAEALLPDRNRAASDAPPDFSSLASDPVMKGILERRWGECQRCFRSGAPLAATVMMGGLLEALFVARANLMANKTPLFKAKATPQDARTKKPLPLPEWTLRPYIDVAGEIGWITRSGKDIAAVLRDYRNYIHPEKERAHGISLTDQDAAMFWEVTKLLALQLLESVKKAP